MTETHSSQRGQRQPESAVIDSDARVLEGLPGLPQLQTWVHRPQALAKCTISDVYKMRTVVYDGAGRYAGRGKLPYLILTSLLHAHCRL